MTDFIVMTAEADGLELDYGVCLAAIKVLYGNASFNIATAIILNKQTFIQFFEPDGSLKLNPFSVADLSDSIFGVGRKTAEGKEIARTMVKVMLGESFLFPMA